MERKYEIPQRDIADVPQDILNLQQVENSPLPPVMRGTTPALADRLFKKPSIRRTSARTAEPAVSFVATIEFLMS